MSDSFDVKLEIQVQRAPPPIQLDPLALFYYI